jgi:Mg2+ and Co2+ transporter CorA
MIKIYTSLEDFKKEVDILQHGADIETITSMDFTFFEHDDDFTLIYVPDYDILSPDNVLVAHKKNVYVCTNKKFNHFGKDFKEILKKPYGESTVIILLLLRSILKNYSHEFDKIRQELNGLEADPVLEKVEDSGKRLRRLTDRFEELYQLIIILKERDIKEFNTSYIGFDYDVLNAEARYWLDKCRSHVYRISSLRTKTEMKSNRELNATMSRLTIIMTFLTIIGIVVNVPSTLGAIFGIPAFSDAYFKNNIPLMVWTLIISTLISIMLGYLYWRSLRLNK